MASLSIALAQLNPVVGDIEGNAAKLLAARAEASRQGADLVLFPELFMTGYPPEDLVLKPAFQEASRSRVERLAAELGPGPAVLVGAVWPDGGKVHNAVALLDEGAVAAVRHKVDLPNYGVFDEKRVFDPGPQPEPIPFRDWRLGVPVCEDIWKREVTARLAAAGADLLLVPNGSPFDWTKPGLRVAIARARAAETGLPLVYVNQVGGQDELVFDGGSFAMNAGGGLAARLPAWREEVATTRWTKAGGVLRCEAQSCAPPCEGDGAAYHACVLGVRDYVEKNGFPGVVLGLSGGVDSALVAAIAADALGPDKVHCLMLPYRYTSNESLSEAADCAERLGVRYGIVPIEPAVSGFAQSLAPLFKDKAADVTEENIQSRTRGTALMAVSNKFGALVLTTGNKSEMSVGYATLYGDMNGGFNPIKDLYKTEAYRLCRWRNANVPAGSRAPKLAVIPDDILTKAPTAELRENQKDQDSLPPYEVLDAILSRLVEKEEPVASIVASGFEEATVRKVERLLYLAEYKRRQAAPGVKISSRSFGRDRRYPITNRFRER